MVDEEIVVTKLEQINEYTNDLEDMRGMSKERYVSDVVIQRAVERTLLNLIQSCIDLAQHIRAAEDHLTAQTSKEEIEALGEEDVISPETQDRLERPSGFGTCLRIDTETLITTLSTRYCTRISTGSNAFSKKSRSGYRIKINRF